MIKVIKDWFNHYIMLCAFGYVPVKVMSQIANQLAFEIIDLEEEVELQKASPNCMGCQGLIEKRKALIKQ